MTRGQAARAVVDQGIWAIRSLLIVVLVARSSTAHEFGLLSLGVGALLFLSGLGACFAGDVLSVTRGVMLRGRTVDRRLEREVRHASGRALALVVLVALASPVVVLAVGVLFGGSAHVDRAMWTLVITSPLAVVAEGCRAMLYAHRAMGHAMSVSLTWLGGQLVATALLARVGSLDASRAMEGWLAGAVLATAMGLFRTRVLPRLRGATRQEWARRRQYAFEYIATTGPTQAMAFFAGGLLGLQSAAAIRALQSLYGPLNVLLAGMANAVVPAKALDPSGSIRAGRLVAVLAVGVAGVATLVLAAVPMLGRAMMGSSWPGAASVVIGYGLGRCAQGMTFGAQVVYRAHDGGWLSWRLRLITAVALLVPFVFGSLVSLEGGVWASSAGGVVTGALWWTWLRRVVGEEQRGPGLAAGHLVAGTHASGQSVARGRVARKSVS